MAKVYVVWFDNCEYYEDNYQEIESIHATYEGAVEYIRSVIQDCGDNVIQIDTANDIHNGNMPMWVLRIKDSQDDATWWHEDAYTIREFELNA